MSFVTPAVPCAGRQARGAFGLCAGGRQEHAQPAGAQAEARGREVSQDRLRCAEPGSIVRGHLPRWPQASAEGDRARPRRTRASKKPATRTESSRPVSSTVASGRSAEGTAARRFGLAVRGARPRVALGLAPLPFVRLVQGSQELEPTAAGCGQGRHLTRQWRHLVVTSLRTGRCPRRPCATCGSAACPSSAT